MIPNHAEYMKHSGNVVQYVVEEIDGTRCIVKFKVEDFSILEFIIHNQPKLTQCEASSDYDTEDDWLSFEVDNGGTEICLFLMENIFMEHILWEEIDDYSEDNIIRILIPNLKNY